MNDTGVSLKSPRTKQRIYTDRTQAWESESKRAGPSGGVRRPVSSGGEAAGAPGSRQKEQGHLSLQSGETDKGKSSPSSLTEKEASAGQVWRLQRFKKRCSNTGANVGNTGSL